MNRRALLAALAAGSLLRTRLALAQRPQKVYRIGFLGNTEPNADLVTLRKSHPAPRSIDEGLRELGWVEGKNVQQVWKSNENRSELSPGIIDEFVRMPVDVLVVFNPASAQIALQKTRTIPIVAVAGLFVEQGLVASLGRPGGNLTGISLDAGDFFHGKLLQLLKSAAPRITRVAFLARVGHGDFHAETHKAATALGLTIFHVRYKDAEFEHAVAEAVRQGANGLVFLGTAHLQYAHFQRKAHEVCARHRLPAMHTVLSTVETGGLRAYSLNEREYYRRVPYFIDRILKGANPAELPIEQVDRIELHLNLGTAKELGLNFPASLVTQADRVFQ